MSPKVILTGSSHSDSKASTANFAGFLVGHLEYITVLKDLSSRSAGRTAKDFLGVVEQVEGSNPTTHRGSSKANDKEFYKFSKKWAKEHDGDDLDYILGTLLERLVYSKAYKRFIRPNSKHEVNVKVQIEHSLGFCDSGEQNLDFAGWDQNEIKGEFYECKKGISINKPKCRLLTDIKDALDAKSTVAVISLESRARLVGAIEQVHPGIASKINLVGFDDLEAGFLNNPSSS
ncbi:MAG: hypothetical protein WC866_03460 [Patescibacteria group bacterium]|jgi:hypothetical protein